MKELIEVDNILTHISSKKYFLCYITAKWCGPCKRIYPMLLKLEKGLNNDSIEFLKIDVDDNETFCEINNIQSVPTFFLYKDGVKIDTVMGSDIIKIGEMLKKYI
jgi:thioredoxin 1